MTKKLELKEILTCVDLDVKSAWDDLSEEEQKELKKQFYILNRYVSNADSNKREVQEHFVLTVNEYYNKHWAGLQQHPKLLWMLLCMCSFDKKSVFFHQYIKPSPAASTKRAMFLAELMPNRKMDEVELLAKLASDKEIKDLARDHGMDEATIAKKIK